MPFDSRFLREMENRRDNDRAIHEYNTKRERGEVEDIYLKIMRLEKEIKSQNLPTPAPELTGTAILHISRELTRINEITNHIEDLLHSRPATSAAEQSKPECGKYPRCTEECNIWWGCSHKAAKAAREQVLPYLEELASDSVSDARKREILESLRGEVGSLLE